MTKRPTRETAKPSAIPEQNSASLTYPKRLASACAEVLAIMLTGEAMTAADTLDEASTMRAAAQVHYLKERYGWPIVSEPRAV